ncbi:MAG TPA: TetR/AcrR family transcriptional regulator [Solirubrobacteraceae bacterium]|jgi:AcrR family transcriptional regulator|nr:TetR/AcrR family transcriptional regulator [Solirubrobacteraceae bacterium]
MRAGGTEGPRGPERVDQRRRAARAEGRDARQELLSAAADVISERGFHDASIDAVAERAGYSKGTVYWHFAGKDDLFLALVEERVDRPAREMIDLLRSAPPAQDMAPEASRRFAELLAGQRSWLLLDNEHWLQAMRDPELRVRYAERQRELRAALGAALATRAETLGAGQLAIDPERIATAFMALSVGLAQQALVDPDAVSDDLLGEIILLIYKGLTADAREPSGGEGPPA